MSRSRSTNPYMIGLQAAAIAYGIYSNYTQGASQAKPDHTRSHTESLYERDNLSRLHGVERIDIFLQPFIALFAKLEVSHEAFLSQSVLGEVNVQRRIAPSSSSSVENSTSAGPLPMTMARFLSCCMVLIEQAEQLRQHVHKANQEPSDQGRDLAVSSAFEKGFQVLQIYREIRDVLCTISSDSELLILRNGLNPWDTSIQEELERMYAPVAIGEKDFQLRLPAEPLSLQSVGETGIFGGRQPSRLGIASLASGDVTFSFELEGHDVKYGAHVWLKFIPDYSHGPYKVLHWDDRFREPGACNRSVCLRDRIVLKDINSNQLLSREKSGNKFKVGLGLGNNWIWVVTRSI